MSRRELAERFKGETREDFLRCYDEGVRMAKDALDCGLIYECCISWFYQDVESPFFPSNIKWMNYGYMDTLEQCGMYESVKVAAEYAKKGEVSIRAKLVKHAFSYLSDWIRDYNRTVSSALRYDGVADFAVSNHIDFKYVETNNFSRIDGTLYLLIDGEVEATFTGNIAR